MTGPRMFSDYSCPLLSTLCFVLDSRMELCPNGCTSIQAGPSLPRSMTAISVLKLFSSSYEIQILNLYTKLEHVGNSRTSMLQASSGMQGGYDQAVAVLFWLFVV